MDVRHRHSESGKFSLAQRYSVPPATAAPSPSLIAVVRAPGFSLAFFLLNPAPSCCVLSDDLAIFLATTLCHVATAPLDHLFQLHSDLFQSHVQINKLKSTNSRACARTHPCTHKNSNSTHWHAGTRALSAIQVTRRFQRTNSSAVSKNRAWLARAAIPTDIGDRTETSMCRI